MSQIIIYVPSPFPYESTKAVPWNYNFTTHVNENKGNMKDKTIESLDTNVTKISITSGIT